MADFRPFNTIRPSEEMVKKIASLPYDVYNRVEARKIVQSNSSSFLKVDRPETQLPEEIGIYDNLVYQKAKESLDEMVNTHELIKDESLAYYIYELTMKGKSQTGLVGCISIDDYINKIIRKNENTLTVKENDRSKHIEVCGAQTGPVFLTYKSDASIKVLVNNIKKEKSLYDFNSDDNVRHRVWKIANDLDLKKIYSYFQSIDKIYIADGHHRAASAVKVGLNKRKSGIVSGEHNYFLCAIFPSDELNILPYNRVVSDLNGLSVQSFLSKLSNFFNITEHGKEAYVPQASGYFGMYLNKNWYSLQFKLEKSSDPVKRLDVSVLQEYVLSALLNVSDPKTDKRIKFVGGIKPINELVDGCDGGVAFTLFPITMNEVMEVSDAGLLLPPKSTWFEPKLRSGIFIHEI